MSDSNSASLPVRPSLEQLRKQAKNLLRSFKDGDADAVNRVRRHKPQKSDPSLADAQFALAKEYGFESWTKLVRHVEAARATEHGELDAHAATDLRAAAHGLSARPPFFKVDWHTKRLEPRQPLSEEDWDTIIDVMREHAITSLDAGGQMTDEVLERLSQLDQLTSLRLGGWRGSPTLAWSTWPACRSSSSWT